MKLRSGMIGAIGNTPLIRLRRASEATGAEILGKAEFLNPGGSIKDRSALFMIRDAERRGELRPGGLIVEGTRGNTGIGLTLVGNALGYRTVIVMPENQTREKKDLLRLYGAQLEEVPAVPYRDPRNYVHVAERLAKDVADMEEDGVFYVNQWDNPSNREAHRQTTGPEIWTQTGGHVDGFVGSIGTGGTLAGVGIALSGVNVAGAIRLARDLGPGHTIVTVLPDAGARYQSTLYDPGFLGERGLPAPRWLEGGRMTARLVQKRGGAIGLRTASPSMLRTTPTDATSPNARCKPSIHVWDEDEQEAERWARELAAVIAHAEEDR